MALLECMRPWYYVFLSRAAKAEVEKTIRLCKQENTERVQERQETIQEVGYYQTDPWTGPTEALIEAAAPIVAGAVGVPYVPPTDDGVAVATTPSRPPATVRPWATPPPVVDPTDYLSGGPRVTRSPPVAPVNQSALSAPVMVGVAAAIVGGAVYLAQR